MVIIYAKCSQTDRKVIKGTAVDIYSDINLLSCTGKTTFTRLFLFKNALPAFFPCLVFKWPHRLTVDPDSPYSAVGFCLLI